MKSSSRSRSRWVVVSAAVILLTVALTLTYPFEELGWRLGDLQFRLRPARATSSHVALVLIDDASLRRFGRWPWSRSLLARLLRQVSAQRPAVTALDIVLSEPAHPDQDQELASAIADARNLILASRLTTSPQDPLWVEPLPAFAQAAAGIGHVQAITGPDGICRSVPVQELSANGPRWALAFEIFRVAKKAELRTADNGIWAGTTFLRTQGRPAATYTSVGRIFAPAIALIDFRKQIVPGEDNPSFITVSAADLLDGKPVSELAGKSVLIGLSATDASDRFFTPVSDRLPMPGVELHANLLDALMEGRSLHVLAPPFQFLMLVALGALCTFIALRWPGVPGLLFTIAIASAVLVVSLVLFVRANIVFDLAPLLCATVLAFPLAQVHTFVVVNRAVARALLELRQTLTEATQLPSNLRRADDLRTTTELSWKFDVLSRFQKDLVSLYSFRQNLLLAMQEGVAVYDEHGCLLFSNPRWHTFCETQNLDRDVSLEQLAAGLNRRELANLAMLGDSQTPLEAEIQTNDSLWQLRACRVETGDNKPSLLVVATDLTSRLERDRARSEALGFFTHELRTPLASIQGFAEVLVRYPKSANGPEVASTIFRESRRLVALINTYLDVLRLDTGQVALRPEELNLCELATQVNRIIEPIAHATRSQVITEIASGLPRLDGDPNLIAGVLLNLLNNAVKYSPPGSQIKMKIALAGKNVALEVSNPGPPIPVGDLDHIFESFYRGREEAGHARGWGIGLAFVKRIAESHGGRVEVTSDSAATVFRIVLPSAGQPRATDT